MIGQGRGAASAPHIVVFPGLALMITVIGFNLDLGRWTEGCVGPSIAMTGNQWKVAI